MPTYSLNCETTGKLAIDQVIELAYLPLLDLSSLRVLASKTTGEELKNEVTLLNNWTVHRFNPTVPINKRAYELHGISKVRLIKEPSSLKVLEYLPKDMKFMVGYNIPFDYKILGRPKDILLIDLLAIVRKLRKEHPEWRKLELANNKLDTYMKAMYPELSFAREHSAKEDCIKSILLLCKVLPALTEVDSWEGLFKYTAGVKKV